MNWRSLSVGRKISGVIGVVLLLLLAFVAFTVFGVTVIRNDAVEAINGNRLDSALAQREIDHLNWAQGVNMLFADEKTKKLNVQTDPHKCALGRWLYGEQRRKVQNEVPSLAPLLKAIEPPHNRLHASALEVAELYRPVNFTLNSFVKTAKSLYLEDVGKVRDALLTESPALMDKVPTDSKKTDLGAWLYGDNFAKFKGEHPPLAKVIEPLYEPQAKLYQSFGVIKKLMEENKIFQAKRHFVEVSEPLITKTGRALNQLISWFEDEQAASDAALAVYADDTVPQLRKIQGLLHKIRAEAKKHLKSDQGMLADTERMKNTSMLVGFLALAVGVFLALVLSRSITKPLKAAAEEIRGVARGDFTFSVGERFLGRKDELGEMIRDIKQMNMDLSQTVRGVLQTAQAVSETAQQINQGNNNLNDRTQQQASALEETASAVEQLTGWVRANADQSTQADHVAKKTAAKAREGKEMVERVVEAMGAVAHSSKRINEIIGVVNDIAFKTNLLALNAAVEAARAGEAGRGFAVVAGEVRNLAGSSAKAAKEIKELIADSVKKAEQGDLLVKQSGELLNEIMSNVESVSDVIAEVSSTSQEQAQGITEVNRAVGQMDEAVQQNAAMVEEAASASQDMAFSAQELKKQMSQFKLGDGQVAAAKTRPPVRKPAPSPVVMSTAPKMAAKPGPTKKPEKETAKPVEDDFFAGIELEGFEEF